MKLLYTKRSPYARKVRVIALEKHIPLEFIEEDLTNKTPRLTAVNPLGKIPTMIFDDGWTLCDSPVICAYLDTLKSRPRFIPAQGKKRWEILHYAAVADGLMDVTVAAYMERVRHPQNANEDFIKAQEESVKRCLKFFNDSLHRWEGLNIAAVAVASAIGYIQFRLGHLAPSTETRVLKNWFDRFSHRPSMTATVPG